MYQNSYQTSASSAQSDTSNNPFGPPDDSRSRWPDLSREQNASHQFGNVTDDFPAVQNRTPRSPWNTYATFPGGGNWPVGQSSSTTTYPQTTSYFQPAYGQQQQSTPTNLNQQPSYTGYSSYQTPQYSAQVPSQTGYQNPNLSQFDPYSNGAASQWGSQQTQQQQPMSPLGGMTSPNPGYGQTSSTYQSNQPHPRDYIKNNKQGLESWDEYSWKQAINSFDGLRQAWEKKHNDLLTQQGQQAQYGYADPQLDQMVRTAHNNIGSIAAASYQMKEVYQGYKISADPSSRKRVKEALNAGLTGLPEWPQA